MAFCPNCGAQVEDGAAFCPQCGTVIGNSNGNGSASAAYFDPYDHTGEYDPMDVSDNKVFAMLCYLMGTIGIIIALLASHESPYIRFHIRQAMKLTVTTLLTGICSVLLVWTIIVPIAGALFCLVLKIIAIIAFFQVCSGSAKEPVIIRSIGFLK